MAGASTRGRSRTAVALALAAVAAVAGPAATAGEDPPKAAEARFEFGWDLPVRVPLFVEGPAMEIRSDLAVERAADGGLRIRESGARMTEVFGDPVDSRTAAFLAEPLEVAAAARSPEVLASARGVPLDAPDALASLRSGWERLQSFEGVAVGRLLGRPPADPVDENTQRTLRMCAMWRWNWLVGAWADLPARPGRVFEGKRTAALRGFDADPVELHATIDATPPELEDGPWTLTFAGTAGGDAARRACERIEPVAGSAVTVSVRVVARVEPRGLRPHEVRIVETLEWGAEDSEEPRRRSVEAVLRVEWTPRPVAPQATPAELQELDAVVAAYFEADRRGDLPAVRALQVARERRGSDRDEGEPWPSDCSWSAFRRRIEGDWALAAVRLRVRGGEKVDPVLLRREEGVWRVAGAHFAPAEAGLIAGAWKDAPPPRWVGRQILDWTLEFVESDTEARIDIDGAERVVEARRDAPGRSFWFRIDRPATIEVRAVGEEGAEPFASVSSWDGRVRPTRGGSSRFHVTVHALGPGSYCLAAGARRPGRIRVSLSTLRPRDVHAGEVIGPVGISIAAPFRGRVRASDGRTVSVTFVPVECGRKTPEVYVESNSRAIQESSVRQASEARLPGVTDGTIVGARPTSDAEAEWFVVVRAESSPGGQEVEPDGAASGPSERSELRVGEERELELAAGRPHVVRVLPAAAEGTRKPAVRPWRADVAPPGGADVAYGLTRVPEHEAVVLVARSGTVRVRLRIASAP